MQSTVKAPQSLSNCLKSLTRGCTVSGKCNGVTSNDTSTCITGWSWRYQQFWGWSPSVILNKALRSAWFSESDHSWAVYRVGSWLNFHFQPESPFYQSYRYRLYLVDNRKQTRFKFHCSDMVDLLQDGEISSMTHQCGGYGLVQSSFVLLYRWGDIDFSAHFFARHHIAVEIEPTRILFKTHCKQYPCAALAHASFSFDSSTDVHGYRCTDIVQ